MSDNMADIYAADEIILTNHVKTVG